MNSLQCCNALNNFIVLAFSSSVLKGHLTLLVPQFQIKPKQQQTADWQMAKRDIIN